MLDIQNQDTGYISRSGELNSSFRSRIAGAILLLSITGASSATEAGRWDKVGLNGSLTGKLTETKCKDRFGGTDFFGLLTVTKDGESLWTVKVAAENHQNTCAGLVQTVFANMSSIIGYEDISGKRSGGVRFSQGSYCYGPRHPDDSMKTIRGKIELVEWASVSKNIFVVWQHGVSCALLAENILKTWELLPDIAGLKE